MPNSNKKSLTVSIWKVQSYGRSVLTTVVVLKFDATVNNNTFV